MTDIPLREFFQALLDERDRQYNQRFQAQQSAVEAAFKASQIAIDKAEMQLEGWKATANEFRGQLKDQAATFALDKDLTTLRDRMGTVEGRFYGIALAATVLGAVALVVSLVR